MGTRLHRTRAALLALAGGTVLVCAGVAFAAAGDPKKDFNPADQATAKSFLLVKADLPGKGWVASATDFSQPNPPCFVQHYGLSALTVNGEAGSTFVLGGAIVIESDGHVFGTGAQAARAFAIQSAKGLAGCLGSTFVASIVKGAPKGSTAKIVRISPVRLTVPAAESGFRITLSLHSGTTTAPLDLVYVNLQHGRTFGSLTLIGPGRLWAAPVVRLFAGKMATRMAKR